MGDPVKAKWKPENVLKKIRQHRLASPVGKPIGVQRNERAADDYEKPEANPGHD
jgi:hypothetical protein